MILCMPYIKPLLYRMSPPKRGGYLFGWLLFDPAGPIIVNRLGWKTPGHPYPDCLEGLLDVSVDYCRLKLV